MCTHPYLFPAWVIMIIVIFVYNCGLTVRNKRMWCDMWGSHVATLTSRFDFQFGVSYYTHTRLTVLYPGLPGWVGTSKVKPIWILLKQETVSGSGITWVICKSAPRSRQITTPAPHHSVFYRLDALPAAQPTASKHWSPLYKHKNNYDHNNPSWEQIRMSAHETEGQQILMRI